MADPLGTRARHAWADAYDHWQPRPIKGLKSLERPTYRVWVATAEVWRVRPPMKLVDVEFSDAHERAMITLGGAYHFEVLIGVWPLNFGFERCGWCGAPKPFNPSGDDLERIAASINRAPSGYYYPMTRTGNGLFCSERCTLAFSKRMKRLCAAEEEERQWLEQGKRNLKEVRQWLRTRRRDASRSQPVG